MDKIGILRCGVIQMLSIKVPSIFSLVRYDVMLQAGDFKYGSVLIDGSYKSDRIHLYVYTLIINCMCIKTILMGIL